MYVILSYLSSFSIYVLHLVNMQIVYNCKQKCCICKIITFDLHLEDSDDSVAAIVGGVVGGVVGTIGVAAAIVGFAVFYKYRKNKKNLGIWLCMD